VKIIEGFKNQFALPIMDEGFSEIFTIKDDAELEMALAKIIEWAKQNNAPSKQQTNKKSAPKRDYQNLIRNAEERTKDSSGPTEEHSRAQPKKTSNPTANPWAVLMNPEDVGNQDEDD